jgi:asparagine synthase (glutamine-hydrolysing)
MIYAGIFSFEPVLIDEKEIYENVALFTKVAPTIINQKSLILCCGKLSDFQDADEIWNTNSSILIGRVFDKKSSNNLNLENFKMYSELDSTYFTDNVWGKYVYINAKNEKCEIILDPTGQLPCFFHTLNDGSILFSSHIEIIFKILNKKFDYNWQYLNSYLIHSNSSSIHTPFLNIFEVPPGCKLKITKSEKKITSLWNPLSCYSKDMEQDEIVPVLQKTLGSWIKPYKNICVSLSGGLDSSSIVYCLKNILRSDQNLTAINYYHPGIKSSNELVHAQKVSQETGIKLIEINASDFLPFDPPLKTPILKPNKPLPDLISLKWLESISDYLPINEQSTFISGHGSDHIFMGVPSKSSSADYLIEKGLKGYINQVKCLAQLSRDPIYSILKTNFLDLLYYQFSKTKKEKNIYNTIDEIPNWVNSDVLKNISSEFIHPFLANLSQAILPGKYAQIDSLYEGIASIQVEMMHNLEHAFYPFLYEPVIKSALSYSTYELFKEGFDRYPLRQEVSRTFKTDTVWRRDKSQTTGVFQQGLKRNLERIKTLCLQGFFASNGLIDKKGFELTINKIANGEIKHMWPFMHLASIEIFLNYWENKQL